MKKILGFLLLFTILPACKKQGEDTLPQNTNAALQHKIVANIGEHLIVPSYNDFATACDDLLDACETFADQQDEASLEDAQDTWKVAKLAWKRCEAFNNFGPGETLYINSLVDYPSINVTKIESNISTPSSPSDITDAYIETRTSTAKGLTAMEYLLFDHGDDNVRVLDQYTQGTYKENRKTYLTALSRNLRDKALLIYQAWAPAYDNYLETFQSNTRNDNYGSFSLLVNSFIQQIDLVKTARIGTPLGKTSGTPDAAAVEAYYSHYSLECMRENFQCTQYLMEGKGFENTDSSGIRLLMNGYSSHQNTYNAILQNLATDIGYTQNIPVSLEQAILLNNADADSLYTSSKDLIRLLKLDLCSAIGVTLTFSDADGD